MKKEKQENVINRNYTLQLDLLIIKQNNKITYLNDIIHLFVNAKQQELKTQK